MHAMSLVPMTAHPEHCNSAVGAKTHEGHPTMAIHFGYQLEVGQVSLEYHNICILTLTDDICNLGYLW